MVDENKIYTSGIKPEEIPTNYSYNSKTEYKYKKSCWISKKINVGNYENTDLGLSFEMKADDLADIDKAITEFKTQAEAELAQKEKELKEGAGLHG